MSIPFSYKAILSFFVLHVCSCFNIAATNNYFKVKVYDAQTECPVEYPYIVFKQSKIGLIADENGLASVKTDYSGQDTIKVSCIGYETIIRPVFISSSEPDTIRIGMRQKNIQLKEVTAVKPKKTKHITLGKGGPGGFATIHLPPAIKDGFCLAWRIGAKNKRTWLTGMGIYCNIDSIQNIMDPKQILHPLKHLKLRVNVYDAEGAKFKDGSLSLPEPSVIHSVIVDYSSDKIIDGVFKVIFPESVLLPEKSLVEIELLGSIPEGETFIYQSNLLEKQYLIRYIHRFDYAWIKCRFASPFFLTFIQECF